VLAAALICFIPAALSAAPRAKPKSAAGRGKKATAPEPAKEPAPEPAKESPAPEPAKEAPPEEPPKAPAAEPAKELPVEAPAKAAPADEPHPQASEPATAEASTEVLELGRREADRIAAGRTLVAVWLSGGVANRHFRYSDAVGDELPEYRLPVAPMASVGLEAYPAASTRLPFLRDLGLRGHVSRGFAFDSDTPQGVSIETSWTRFGGELRWRLLLPSAHPFELGVAAGADASYFGMTAKGAVPALLPAARTVSLRFGVDARVLIAWRLSFLAGGGYLATTSRGEIYSNFRSPRVMGLDGDAGFAVDLGEGFELRLAGRYTRYWSKFRPQIGDRYAAGGAVDEQLQTSLGVRYAH
jgi:hypothetical protein